MKSLLREYISACLEERTNLTLTEIFGESKITASPAFLKKEAIRQCLQDAILNAVSRGDVKDEAALRSLFVDIDTAATALKSIPLQVWLKLAAK